MLNIYKTQKFNTSASDSIAKKIGNSALKETFQAKQQYALDMAQENTEMLTKESYKNLAWDSAIRKELGLDNKATAKSFQSMLGVQVSMDTKKEMYSSIAVDNMESNYRCTINKGLSYIAEDGSARPMIYIDEKNKHEVNAVMDSNNPTVQGVPYSMLVEVLPRNRMFSQMMRKLTMREYVGETIQAGSLWTKALQVMFRDYTMNGLEDITLYADGQYEGYTNMNITADLLPVARFQETVSIGIEEQGEMGKAGIDLFADKTELAMMSDRNKKDLMLVLGYAPAGIKGYLNWGIARQDLPFPDLSNAYNVYNNFVAILNDYLFILKGHADLTLEVKCIMPPAKLTQFLRLFSQFPLAVKNVISSNLNFSFEASSTLEANMTGLPNDIMIVTAFVKDRQNNPAMEIFSRELSPIGTPQTQGTVQTYVYMTQYTGLVIPFSDYVKIYNLAN